MPLYFFDTRYGDTVVSDETGLECQGIEEARDQAALCLAEMAKDVLPGSTRRELAVEVRDGVPVLRASVVLEAVQLR